VAQDAGPLDRRDPRAACLQAARAAEQAHGLPQGLLVAIALSESGLHAHALNIGGRSHFPAEATEARRLAAQATARRLPVMAGCMQVNWRVHVAPGQDWPLDPRRAVDWAARDLRRHYDRSGSWAEAIRRWHGGSGAEAQRILCRVRGKLAAASPGSALLDGQACTGSTLARDGRNGRALIEMAEAPGP
jgi:hypothetical protein